MTVYAMIMINGVMVLKIEAVNENKIIIMLTAGDMSELDISYDRMDYSNIETRRVIWTLLDRASRELGREIDPSGKFLIEAAPVPNGGCMICLTCSESARGSNSPAKRFVLKKDTAPLIYEFDSINDLLDSARAFSRGAYRARSRLYKKQERYRLVVTPLKNSAVLRNLFSEFAHFQGDGELDAQHTNEHWELIIGENALYELCPYAVAK